MQIDQLSKVPIDALPVSEKSGRDIIYNSTDQNIQQWLENNWDYGHNPLAQDYPFKSHKLMLTLRDGSTLNYSDPSHSSIYLDQNKREEKPKYFIHITQSGWIEYAIKQNQNQIGKDTETWTSSGNPNKVHATVFPEDFNFSKPTDRIVELIFDVNLLEEMGLSYKDLGDKLFVFESKLPLEALVPSSKAYIEQVLQLSSIK